MKRALSTRACRLEGVVAIACVLAACKPQPPPPQPPPAVTTTTTAEGFDQVTDAILAAWLAAQPVTATSLGEHAHDGRWPDLAPQAVASDLARIDEGLAKLAALDASALSVDDRIDLDMLKDELLRQKFTHEVEAPWIKDPMWYAGMIGTGLEDLVSRDFAPITERAQSVAARLEALPKLVEQARANLEPGKTMKPHTQVAVDQLDGIVVLIGEVIPARLSGARPDDVKRIAAATEPAIAAVRALQIEVKDELLPKADAPWRLGPEAYAKKLQLTLQSDISADKLRRMAILEHAKVRGQMATIAHELAAELFGPRYRQRIEARSTTDIDSAVIRAVLEELAADHVSPPRLRDRIAENLDRLNKFVRDRKLVTMDDKEVLEVIWTPPHQRGVFIAGLAAPGPLDIKPGLPSFYLVQPVPEDWPADVRDSFLREYNNFMLEVLSIHEAIPGHFVQLYFGKREPSKIRRVLANGAFVEGWAVYAERLMIDAGYSGAAPPAGATRPRHVSKKLWEVMNDDALRHKAIRLHALKFYLRSVTNAILDQSVHAGGMEELEALELMVDRSFQQEGEARAKWVRAQVTSAQLSTYYVGAQAWLRLREEAEKQPGFELAAFHDAALSHGAPPVPLVRGFLWPDAPGEPAAPAEPAETKAPEPAK